MTFRKKIGIVLLVLLFVLAGGLYYANGKAKGFGYTGLMDVVKTYSENSELSKKVEAKKLNINISSTDLDFIKSKREIAIDRGIQINEGDNYVPCEIDFDGDKSAGEIRLKGHMTDHLQGNKWSYRVKTDKPVLGMYRFSIQHPGTRNYIYEWIYHQLLKNESVIYLYYDFVEVIRNEESLGMYALEEHFGQHVLERNKKPPGAILRWNPELYWDWRIDELQGNFINEQYSNFSSSFVEPYDRGNVKDDSILNANYQRGAYLLEMFRRGELTTSEVFDIERMARFHVIIDLVGGYHSLDWSDVKFYYNSESKRIEPVGYESFSVRKTETIAGQRVPRTYEKTVFNYHDMLFSDPQFFESYIQNMERIVSESYLNDFMVKIKPELDEKMGLIGKEWPYRKVSFDGYFENVKLIRNNIDLPKPFHAFIEPSDKDSLRVTIAPVSDYPIQIVAVKRNDKIKELSEIFDIPAKARNTYTKYFTITIPNPFSKHSKLSLVAKIPGSSKTFTVKISDLPSYKSEQQTSTTSSVSLSSNDTSVLVMQGDNWFFNSDVVQIKNQIKIPKSKTLSIYPNQKVELLGDGGITVFGTLKMIAFSDDEPIMFSNKSRSGITVDSGNVSATHVHFSGNNLFSAAESNITFSHCIFFDMDKLCKDISESKLDFYKCSSGSMNSLGVLNESVVSIKESNFRKGKLFAESNGSLLLIGRSKILEFEKGFDLNYGSTAKIHNSDITELDTAANLSFGSQFLTFGGRIQNVKVGFCWSDISQLQVRQDVKLYKTNLSRIEKLIAQQ